MLKKYPQDHIISTGNICNGKCIYCSCKKSKNKKNLNLKIGKKIIDFITSIPLDYIYLEFTGGEPFLNTKTLSEIINYFKRITKIKKISNHISIVSNLYRLTEGELKLILKNKITICTSLDGPPELHNITRKWEKNAYNNLSISLKKIIYYANKGIIEYPNLITTITKHSLNFPKEIINEYLKFNVLRVQLGMVEPLGLAMEKWKEIGITANDYIKFYEKAFDEIIKINVDKKIPLYEKGFMLLLKSIIEKKPHKKRSIPIINRLSYDINGFIHPDDESRMLFESGNLDLRLGSVNTTHNDFFYNQNINKILNLIHTNKFDENCIKCIYSQYCYIPLWYRILITKKAKKPSDTEKCKIFKAIFDMISYTRKNKKLKSIIDNWLNIYG
ncbi:MAG: 4Fe-4S cluster-binding domain-containing protein [Elusimicrobiales bacterium]|nr:4Fe-4S cluster-binding domain-containing protein [Elusimicrobiales bacterium]